jgi:CRP-like cAMP-binding protein
MAGAIPGIAEARARRTQGCRRAGAGIDERFYAGGTCIFREGERLAEVHLLRDGAVELGRRVGNRRVAFQVLGGGDVFADVPVFMRTPTAFDACTIADSVIWSIPALVLFRLLGRRPDLKHRCLVSLAGRMAGLQTGRRGSSCVESLECLVHAGAPGPEELAQPRLADRDASRIGSLEQEGGDAPFAYTSTARWLDHPETSGTHAVEVLNLHTHA